jgi:sugar-phosphatase
VVSVGADAEVCRPQRRSGPELRVMTVHDTPRSWSAHRTRRGLLCDVDGTLLDVLANLRRVWDAWSHRYGLDPDAVYGEALRTRPLETFAIVAPTADPLECLAALHELEDEDAREGDYTAFAGAHELLTSVAPTDWALVTSNYEHRVGIRFSRVGLPLPTVIVDAASVAQGKPDPEGFLSAAAALGIRPG